MNTLESTAADTSAPTDAGSLVYRRLKAGEGEHFRQMTFPAFRDVLAKNDRALPIGAEVESDPLGLALGFLPEDQAEVANLLSIYVTEDRRKQGIGYELIRRFEEAARDERRKILRATYTTGKPGIEAFEHLLQKAGWEPPVGRMLLIKSTISIIQAAPWMKLTELPADMEILAWKDVTEEDRAALRRSQEETQWIPDDLIPFDYEETYEPFTSVALRYQGAIVGWVINHLMSKTLIRFTCAYMRKDLQRLGRVLWLYVDSVRRAGEHNISEGMWTIPMKHTRYVKFATRWMAPYSSFFGETRGVEKRL